MPDIENKYDPDALMSLLGDEDGDVLGGRPGANTTLPVSPEAPIGTGQSVTGRTVTDRTAPIAPPPIAASTFQGFTPKHAMEGFDFAREQNTGKSAKDAFAFLANQAPPPPLNDKAALGAWMKQYIEPGMNQLGHNVSGVEGDKFHLKNWQGDFDVDYGRGAGADGGALAWQVDDGSAQQSNGAYTPQGNGAAQQLGAVKGNTAIDRITAEIEALQNGSASPMDAEALMKALQI